MNDPYKSKFNDDIDLKLFFTIAKKNLKYILIFAVLVFVSVFLYLRYSELVFETSTIVQINSDDKAQKLFESKSIYEDDIFRKIEIMRSPIFLNRVLKKLPLEYSLYSKGKILNFDLYNNIPFQVKYEFIDSTFCGIPIEIAVRNNEFEITSINNRKESHLFSFHETVSLPQINFVFLPNNNKNFFSENSGREFILVFNSIDALASKYSKQVNISVVNDVAKTISISLRDNNSQKSADIVNNIAKEFSNFEIEYQKNSSTNILNFIDSQLENVEGNLDKSRDSMKLVYGATYDTLIDKQSIIKRNLELYNLISINTNEIETLDKFYNSFSNSKIDIISLITQVSGTESHVYLAPYLQALKDLEMRKQELMLHLTEKSTAIENINAQIDFQKKLIKESVLGLIDKYKKQQKRYQKEKDEIAIMLGSATAKNSNSQNKLERFYSVNEKFYNQLIEKKIEYSIAQAGFVSQLIVLQPAQTSIVPIAPNKKMIWLVAFFITFLISLSYLVLQYLLYNEIVSLRDVKKQTNIPILGVIPRYKSFIPISQLIVDIRPRSLIAESLRAIRSNLQFINNKQGPKIIAVSSTVSGEGKTFVAINFAGIIAFSGKKVIVLDFDLRKPKIHSGFNTDNKKGISTILLGIDDVEQSIKHSNIPNLHFITAGKVPINPSELILSEKMEELLAYLKTKYDFIIIDTPPIGLVSDAMKPLQHADYPIYVIKANYSKRTFVKNAEKLYSENKLNNLSIVLNNVDPDTTSAGKSDAYNYGYGYGYDNRKHGYYDSDML